MDAFLLTRRRAKKIEKFRNDSKLVTKGEKEQKAKEAELRNQEIQAEIEQKSAERNQLISMIPQAQYVGSQYTQPQQF